MTSEGYHYRGCGLGNVYLLNGFSIKETRYGKTVGIEDIDGLHRALGDYLVREKKNLNGAEIRFLRHELGLSQRALGTLLDKSDQTLARWEKGRGRIDGAADRLLRLLYQQHTGRRAKVRTLLEYLSELDAPIEREIRFEDTGEGWRHHTAA